MNDGRFRLIVTNTTDGLTEEDVTHLFERFWRKESARSGTGHSGLGLSLAGTFAQVLGCQLTAALNNRSQLTLTLSGSHTVVMYR